MKQLITTIALSILVILFAGLTFNQCSHKLNALKKVDQEIAEKENIRHDYLDLLKAKTTIDTLYREGKEHYSRDTIFKKVIDTFLVENGKVYGLFRDSIITDDLTLHSNIVASDLKSIDHTYSVREKVITKETTVFKTDTIQVYTQRRQLLALADIGQHTYSAGLQYQTRKRIGFTARYNLYQNDKFITLGLSYRIF